MLKRAPRKVVQPYFALAPIYDDVMEHVDYERWALYVHKLLQKFDHNADLIADISCGTGSCGQYLLELGYRVTGSDSSPAMVLQAEKKAAREAWNIHYYCADMCRQPLKRHPDAVVSLYDSMNYLLTDQAWSTCLSEVYAILDSGGKFIFDVSTLHNSLRDFSNYRQKEKVDGGAFVRQSSFEKKTNLQENYFEITLDDNPEILFCETHRQVIRSLDEIISFIDKSQFELVAGYKNFTFKPYTEKSERVHFVLQKR